MPNFTISFVLFDLISYYSFASLFFDLYYVTCTPFPMKYDGVICSMRIGKPISIEKARGHAP